MLWSAISVLCWIGIGLSFLVTLVLSIVQFVVAKERLSTRAAFAVGLWLRWLVAVVGVGIGMVVLGFLLQLGGFAVPTFYSRALGSDRAAPWGSRCPDGYVVKGNADSRLYHLPGDRYYEATKPEACFRSIEAAERAGYRRPGPGMR